MPDARYGEELVAFVIPRRSATVEREQVEDFCRGRIAHQKIPRYVRTVDAFPMTVTGKVQKYKLREQAVHALGLSELTR